MSYGMTVVLRVKPGHMDQVKAIIEGLVPRVTAEEGCLAFTLYTNKDEPDTIWLYEVYVSEEYHSDVHFQYDEVKAVMEKLPEHMAAPWSIYEGETVLAMPQGVSS